MYSVFIYLGAQRIHRIAKLLTLKSNSMHISESCTCKMSVH